MEGIVQGLQLPRIVLDLKALLEMSRLKEALFGASRKRDTQGLTLQNQPNSDKFAQFLTRWAGDFHAAVLAKRHQAGRAKRRLSDRARSEPAEANIIFQLL